jgi:hypothetical protein
VPDRLRYNLKATAVSSTNKMVSQPADGTYRYDGSTTSVLKLVIPHSTYDELCDPTMCRFRLQMQSVFLDKTMLKTNAKIRNFHNNKAGYNTEAKSDREDIFLDRGIESMIRRLDFFIQVETDWNP